MVTSVTDDSLTAADAPPTSIVTPSAAATNVVPTQGGRFPRTADWMWTVSPAVRAATA